MYWIGAHFGRLSYRVRLTLAIVLGIFPLLILMSANRVHLIAMLAYENELSRLTSIGQLLANELAENIVAGDTADLQDIIGLAAQMPSIGLIAVKGPDKRILYASDPSQVGRASLLEDNDDKPSGVGQRFIKSFPLDVGSDAFVVQIEYSIAGVRRHINRALAWALAFTTLTFGAAMMIAWVIAGVMERPIREVTHAAVRVAKGEFDVRLHPRTSDAFGQLALAINAMASDLASLTQGMQAKIDAATATLTEQNTRLRELDTLKSEFVMMVSHELRTPLTSIIGFAATLRRLSLSDEKRLDFIARIEAEGKHLSALIEDYLDISKIEAGTFTISPAPLDMAAFVRRVVDTFPHGARITIRIDDGLPLAMADQARLQGVFGNILDNAVKHGHGMPIHIEAGLRDGMILVSIADEGPGMTEEVRRRVFEKFYRGNPERGGNGIGLAIARSIVDTHGGRLWCDSELGHGSVFSFTLPLAPSGDRHGNA